MDTKRPVNPAAEQILGGYFPVLDHGFVALIDYMGTDDSIERAARVSYGYGTRQHTQTRTLIRYLRRHHHTTPSEMVELQFHCAMPLFVARQWIRHRTACLAGNTEIYFDLPHGIRSRRCRLYKIRIEELWQRFQPTRNRTRPDKQDDAFFRRDRVRRMRLRHMNEDDLRIVHTRITNVYRNGRRPVFRMILADGKQIEATADHRFLFDSDWKSLHEATGLCAVNGRAAWRAGNYYIYVNGSESRKPALYRERAWLKSQYHAHGRPIREIAQDLNISYHTVRKWLRRHNLQKPKGGRAGNRPWNKGMRYDLGPRDPSEAFLGAVRRARSGPASNFWRGGMSAERQSIARWTTQVAASVHQRNGWTCQLCHQRAGELHCHHIVPVWTDARQARDRKNLTTLCGECHRFIQGQELEYVEKLGGPPVRSEWRRRVARVAWNKLTIAKLTRIESFQYVGERETYDLEVDGPHHNFVANGIVTHNSVNEYSARYSLMPLLFYRPAKENFGLQSRANRQGRAQAVAPEELYCEALTRWEQVRTATGNVYKWLLEGDVARELARIDLPLSTYTQWYWKIDLHNLIHFLTLRIDDHAQLEIREYAKVLAGILQRVAPLSYDAWLDYELNGERFSCAELAVLRHFVDVTASGLRVRPGAGPLSYEGLGGYGLSRREIGELLAKLEARERPDFTLDLSRMCSAAEMEARIRGAVPSVG